MRFKHLLHSKWISPALVCIHHFRISQTSCETADLSPVWISLLGNKMALWNRPLPMRTGEICAPVTNTYRSTQRKPPYSLSKRQYHLRKWFFQGRLLEISTPHHHTWHRSQKGGGCYIVHTQAMSTPQKGKFPRHHLSFFETRQVHANKCI